MQLAFVAAEDQNFYQHTGVDFTSIVRAALTNYQAGTTRQGGSTITQQVVKSLLLTPERSYERKLKEVMLAFRLEQQLTKDEILYLYLNQIYLGNGAYGVQAAALEYFGKDVAELTLAEAALLAGLPQAPSRYSPVKHWERARARQRYVLDRMVEEGFVTYDEAEQAYDEKIVLQRREAEVSSVAPYFVEHVRRLLEQRYGSSAPYQLGLDVHTTLNLEMQRAADQALRDGITAVDERQGFRGALRRLTDARAAGARQGAHARHRSRPAGGRHAPRGGGAAGQGRSRRAARRRPRRALGERPRGAASGWPALGDARKATHRRRATCSRRA